jgi:hypothetical protein
MPTNNFNVTRNDLIDLAYKDLGVLAEGETLSADLLNTGIKKLNLIMREHDLAGKHLWAISLSSITLVANTFVYTTSNGLSSSALSIVSASYRNTSGNDEPLDVLTTEQYEMLENKTETGDPRYVYLTENTTVSSKSLYVVPMLSSVNTQSVVTGTDAAAWKCIRAHTAASENKPITGANYLLYWESGGSGPSSWATGTSYVAPELVRLQLKRPLYDFDAASDNPDMPQGWSLFLQKQLAIELAPGHNTPIERVNLLRSLRNESHEKVFRSVQAQTTSIHNKVLYF